MEQKETTLKKYETPQMEVLDIGAQIDLLSCSEVSLGESGITCIE